MPRRRQDLEPFADYLISRGLALSTVYNYVSAIRRIVKAVGSDGLTDPLRVLDVFAGNKPSAFIMARNAWAAFRGYSATRGVSLPDLPKPERRGPPAVPAAPRSPAAPKPPSPVDAALAAFYVDALLNGSESGPVEASEASRAAIPRGRLPKGSAGHAYPLPDAARAVLLRHLNAKRPISAVTDLVWGDLVRIEVDGVAGWTGTVPGFPDSPVGLSDAEYAEIAAYYWPEVAIPPRDFPVFPRTPGSGHRHRRSTILAAVRLPAAGEPSRAPLPPESLPAPLPAAAPPEIEAPVPVTTDPETYAADLLAMLNAAGD